MIFQRRNHMLNKIIQKKNPILIVYAIVLLVFWTVVLIFGNSDGIFLSNPKDWYGITTQSCMASP